MNLFHFPFKQDVWQLLIEENIDNKNWWVIRKMEETKKKKDKVLYFFMVICG